jgi:transposase
MIHNSLFVGIDVSKHKHDIAAIDEKKKLIIKPFVITDNLSGYQFLVHKLKECQEKLKTECFYIGLESTADYWKNLYYYLKKQSSLFNLTVINPVRTKAFAKTELRRAKTDAVNAKDIALFMNEKRPAASIDKAPVFDIIKDMDKRIYQIKKQQTMIVNKLRLELTKVAPEIEKNITTIKNLKTLALLAEYPTAEQIDAVSPEQLAKITYGKNNWKLSIQYIGKMKSLARNSIAYKTGDGAGLVVQSLVRSLYHAQIEIKTLQTQIEKLYKNFNEQDSLLTSIPGFGIKRAIAIEAYIGDINRFSKSEELVAYFGMNPTVDQSGKKKRKSYLQKRGEPIVRHKLFMAVLLFIARKQQPFYSFYVRLVDAGKPKLVAISATMRKLLTIIYAMLKYQRTFDENF